MKKFIALLLIVVSVSMIVACEYEEEDINYKGQLRPISQVEEIIADELEVQNPDLDLDVDIYEESEEE